LYVGLRKNGEPANLFAVHRLVLLAFVGLPEEGQEACHNNGQRGDNRLCNVRWDSHQLNNADKVKHGTSNRGERQGLATMVDDQVRCILIHLKKGNLTQPQLAAICGVPTYAVNNVKHGKSWKYFTLD